MPLKIIRRKGSDCFYLRGTVRGQAVFETTGTDDAKIAEAIRIKRENEILQRSVFGASATVTFLEAATSYLEQGGEARYLGRLDPKTSKWTLLIGHFGSKQIALIDQVEADAAAAKLYPGTSAATRKRQAYTPLSAVLNHAEDKWKVRAEKIKHPKVKHTPVTWASPDYVTKLLPHCSAPLRRFITVMVYTGARLSEALRINWDTDVDFGARSITLGRTKNGEMRTAHMPEPLLQELAGVPESERQGVMFHWSDKTNIRRPLITACKNAGLPYLSAHKLGRHTFAAWMRRYAKRDLRGLMEDGGWKSVNSVMRYAHVVPGESADAVELLPPVQNRSKSKVAVVKPRKTRKKSA